MNNEQQGRLILMACVAVVGYTMAVDLIQVIKSTTPISADIGVGQMMRILPVFVAYMGGKQAPSDTEKALQSVVVKLTEQSKVTGEPV